jgi:hypothetical protein
VSGSAAEDKLRSPDVHGALHRPVPPGRPVGRSVGGGGIPRGTARHRGRQLREAVHRAQAEGVRAREYHEYDDPEWGRKFRTFLHGRAWTHAEGPVALFNQAVVWLRRHRVLLPGVSVLARKVSEVRAVAEKRLHATVARAAHRADAALPGDLVATLAVPEGARFSELERLRRPPTRTTGTAFARSAGGGAQGTAMLTAVMRRARSTTSWCRPPGARRCTRTPICRRGRWTGTRTWCACWSSCTGL